MSLSTSFDDYLNPILLKEMRHLLRGNAFYAFFIIIILSISGIMLYAVAKPDVISATTAIKILFAVIGIFGFGAIPNHLIDISKNSLKNKTDELISISTLPNSEIAKGYLQLSLILLTSLFAASIPFAFIPIFIGQMDIQKIIILLTISYLLCILAIMWNTVAAIKIKNSPEQKTVIDFFFSGVHGVTAAPLIWIFTSAIEGKILNNFSDAFIWIALEIFFVIIFYFVCFHSSSKRTKTPDKLLSFRVQFTVIWAITMFLCFIFNQYIEAVLALVTILLCGYSLFIHSESEGYSERFIDEMPSNPFVKALKFPFVNGVANGIVWLAVITVLTCSIYYLIYMAFQPKLFIFKTLGTVIFTFVATFNAYLFLGNLARKVFFKKTSKGTNALIALILFICIGCLPAYIMAKPDKLQVGYNTYLVTYRGPFAPMNFPTAVSFWNPVAVAIFTEDASAKAIIMSLLLLGLGILSNAKLLYKQTTDYIMEIPYENEDEDSEP